MDYFASMHCSDDDDDSDVFIIVILVYFSNSFESTYNKVIKHSALYACALLLISSAILNAYTRARDRAMCDWRVV